METAAIDKMAAGRGLRNEQHRVPLTDSSSSARSAGEGDREAVEGAAAHERFELMPDAIMPARRGRIESKCAPVLTLNRTRQSRREMTLPEVLLWLRIERVAIPTAASDRSVHSGFLLRIGTPGRGNRWSEPRSGFSARNILSDEAIEGVLVSIERAAAPY